MKDYTKLPGYKHDFSIIEVLGEEYKGKREYKLYYICNKCQELHQIKVYGCSNKEEHLLEEQVSCRCGVNNERVLFHRKPYLFRMHKQNGRELPVLTAISYDFSGRVKVFCPIDFKVYFDYISDHVGYHYRNLLDYPHLNEYYVHLPERQYLGGMEAYTRNGVNAPICDINRIKYRNSQKRSVIAQVFCDKCCKTHNLLIFDVHLLTLLELDANQYILLKNSVKSCIYQNIYGRISKSTVIEIDKEDIIASTASNGLKKFMYF